MIIFTIEIVILTFVALFYWSGRVLFWFVKIAFGPQNLMRAILHLLSRSSVEQTVAGFGGTSALRALREKLQTYQPDDESGNDF